jgi:hypothetical protein
MKYTPCRRADQSLQSPAPRLDPCNRGRVHLGRAKEHTLPESVSVAEYFDIEAHALTKTHDLEVRVRDDGLDAVTQTQFANGYQKIGGDLDLRASRIVADAKTGAFPDGGGAQRRGIRIVSENVSSEVLGPSSAADAGFHEVGNPARTQVKIAPNLLIAFGNLCLRHGIETIIANTHIKIMRLCQNEDALGHYGAPRQRSRLPSLPQSHGCRGLGSARLACAYTPVCELVR